MRLLTFTRTACLFLVAAFLTVAGTARAADPRPTETTAKAAHPARSYVDQATAAVRSRPEDSVRDARTALKILASQPDADLEIQARLLLCDHLSERDQPAAEAEVAEARALLPRATRRGLEAGVLTCEGTILETVSENARARELYEQAVAVATRA